MKKGFTLTEIMIVTAVIALLAAIAIPNLFRSRLNAKENHAASNLQTVSVAAQTYWSAQNALPTTLGQLYNEHLIDSTLGCCNEGCSATSCTKNGYTYSMGGTGTDTDFFIYAIPATSNDGTHAFCAISDGVVRVNPSGVTPPETRNECYDPDAGSGWDVWGSL